MKRLWAAAAILAVLLGGTLWNAWYAERLTGGMIQQLKQAQERTAQGDWEGAAELSEQAFQSWQDHEAYLRAPSGPWSSTWPWRRPTSIPPPTRS